MAASGPQNTSPERHYNRIVSQRPLSPSFFHSRSLSTESDSSTSSSSSFKLSEQHALTIFNSLRDLTEKPAMTSPEKRRYLQSLNLINERQTGIQRPRKSQDAESDVKPPQSLKDIFKISNRNRKKNKQKKKVCKDAEPEAEVASLSAIIAAQYKQDASHERPLRQMDDFELMRHLGWINQEQVDSMRKERSRHFNAYQGSSTQYNSGGSCNSS